MSKRHNWRGYCAALARMSRVTSKAAVLITILTSQALASGEDYQPFEGQCRSTGKQTRVSCVFNVRGCLGSYARRPLGYDAWIAKKRGDGSWQRVTPVTHYTSCVEEQESSEGKSLTLRTSHSETYGLFLDRKGDGMPPYKVDVLLYAPFISLVGRGPAFKISIRRK